MVSRPPRPAHRPDGAAAVLDRAAGAAGSADLADEVEDEVLRRDVRGERPVEAHAHLLRPTLIDGLRRQHMHDLAAPHPECERAQAAMRAGVAVAAHDEAAGLRQAEFRAHHVHDPLAILPDVVNANAGARGFFAQAPQQRRRRRIGLVGAAGDGGDAVIGRRGGQLRIAHAKAALAQLDERLHAVEIVHEVAVDVKERQAVAKIGDLVLGPHLLEQGRSAHRVVEPCRCVGQIDRRPSFVQISPEMSTLLSTRHMSDPVWTRPEART